MIISRRFAARGMECPGAFAAFSNGRCCSGDRQLWVGKVSTRYRLRRATAGPLVRRVTRRALKGPLGSSSRGRKGPAASFIDHTEASTGAELPRFVKDEFDAFLDMQHCPNCGGRRAKDHCGHPRAVIDKILAHLGLDPQPPPTGRAREAAHD
jgi:hypothetical protein